jgi:hypothetical protein
MTANSAPMKGGECEHRPRACGAESSLRQQIETQAEAIARGAYREQPQHGVPVRQRLVQRPCQKRRAGSTQHRFGRDDLAGIAFGQRPRQRVVESPRRGRRQHRQETHQASVAVARLIEDQDHAANGQKHHRRPNATIHPLAVKISSQ